MKELIKKNECGLFVSDKDKQVRVNSKYVAEVFNKNHKDVLRDIKELIIKIDKIEPNTGKRKFAPSYYISSQNKKLPCYEMNRDAFTLLVMGYTTENALKFKLWYIDRFNEMEEQLSHLLKAHEDAPRLTNALLAKGKNEWYHYSNEFNMINSLVLGMSTKKFRELNNIPKDTSIRPYLSNGQIKLIEEIQLYDSVLIDMVDDFKTRKAILKSKFIDEE